MLTPPDGSCSLLKDLILKTLDNLVASFNGHECVACSGGTPDHPGLLQYTVKLKANIRPVRAARVSAAPNSKDSHSPESIQSLLTGRPVIAFAFDNMEVGPVSCQNWLDFLSYGI